jgi:hypothetical protein
MVMVMVGSTTVTACDAPLNYSINSDDCDDGDSSISPIGSEISNDGIDQDCSGQDLDTRLMGNLELFSSADAELFCSYYDSILGTLTLSGSWSDGDSLSCLKRVSGTLKIRIENSIAIELNNLERVGLNLWVLSSSNTTDVYDLSEADIDSLQLDSLSSVGGELRARGLNAFHTPLLSNIGTRMRLEEFGEADISSFTGSSLVHITCDSGAGGSFDGSSLCSTLELASTPYSIEDCQGNVCRSTGWGLSDLPEQEPATSLELPRLTKDQYFNTIHDLWEPLVSEAEAYSLAAGDNKWPAIYTPVFMGSVAEDNPYSPMTVPDDSHTRVDRELRGGWRRMDQVVQDEHVVSWISRSLDTANSIDCWAGIYVVNHAHQAGRTDPDSTTYGMTKAEANDLAAYDFIAEFAPRAWRRSPTTDERDFLNTVYDDARDQYDGIRVCSGSPRGEQYRGLRDVIAVILNHPYFLYRLELGDDDGELTAHELANRDESEYRFRLCCTP